MKKLIAPILICTVILTACHNNKPTENVEETTAETTIETTVETTVETTEETESTEPAETNLNGASEIPVPEELMNGYWNFVNEEEQITWHFNSWPTDPSSTGYNADLEKRDMFTYEITVNQDFDYFVFDDNTIYMYAIDRGTRNGNYAVYSYSLDGDSLTLTKLMDVSADGTIYENPWADEDTRTFTRQFEADTEN